MNNPSPDLVVLPFRATLTGTSDPLTFNQVVALLNKGLRKHIQIVRSYPGAPEAIGWTVFHRTSRAYCHENERLFRAERGARRHIRKVYAIHYSLNDDDLMTYTHFHLKDGESEPIIEESEAVCMPSSSTNPAEE